MSEPMQQRDLRELKPLIRMRSSGWNLERIITKNQPCSGKEQLYIEKYDTLQKMALKGRFRRLSNLSYLQMRWISQLLKQTQFQLRRKILINNIPPLKLNL